jgi:Ca2+-binding RTX toxin-like protein
MDDIIFRHRPSPQPGVDDARLGPRRPRASRPTWSGSRGASAPSTSRSTSRRGCPGRSSRARPARAARPRGKESLLGHTGADTLIGGARGDLLRGGDGRDLLIGGLRADRMWGGPGADIFRWTSVTESSPAQRDRVADFDATEGDRLDLSALVAGTFAFTGSAPIGASGAQLRLVQGPGTSRVDASPEGGTVDMSFLVTGTTPLTAADLLL